MNVQGGQSLVEFAIGSATLSLLLLGAITVAGYQEVQRRASFAARQIAFESSWQPGGMPLQATRPRAFAQHFDDDGVLDAVGRTRYVAMEDVRVAQGGLCARAAGDAAGLLLRHCRRAVHLRVVESTSRQVATRVGTLLRIWRDISGYLSRFGAWNFQCGNRTRFFRIPGMEPARSTSGAVRRASFLLKT
jgi:hypothetical protein